MTTATTIAKPVTEQTPAEIDTQLFPLWTKKGMTTDHIFSITHERKGFSRHYTKKTELTWREEDALKAAQERLQEIEAKIAPLQAEYERRGGWSRVFHVVNGNGHTHRTMHCQTCFPTTQFAYRPELSGLSEDDIIGAIGETACSVCYPDAPTNPRYQEAIKRSAAEKAAAAAAKQAEKDEKAAAKAAKAIAHPDGGTLYGIKTHREARIEIVDAYDWRRMQFSHIGHDPARREHYERNIAEYDAKIERIAQAIAHKEGITVEQAKQEAKERLLKRR